MAYAGLSDLKARAGHLSKAWSGSTSPSDPGDLQSFLDQAAGKIDAVLEGYSLTVPVEGNAAAALAELNAMMAVLTALRATFPSGTGPQEAEALISSLQDQLYGASGEWTLLMQGKHPAVTSLVTEQTPGGTAFWLDEPTYGEFWRPEDLLGVNPQTLPLFSRLSRL
jgi:hypothetical protein